jgi:hypothetical protein
MGRLGLRDGLLDAGGIGDIDLGKGPPISCALACPTSALRSNSVTFAPRAASNSAVAAPRPEAPPVTMAANPLISMHSLPDLMV